MSKFFVQNQVKNKKKGHRVRKCPIFRPKSSEEQKIGHLVRRSVCEVGKGWWGTYPPVNLVVSPAKKKNYPGGLCFLGGLWFFFSDIFGTLSEFFAQYPKYLERFLTKCPKKICLQHNNTLVAAPCSLTYLKFCDFLFATKPLPL